MEPAAAVAVRLARREDLPALQDLRDRAMDAQMFPAKDRDLLVRTLASPMGGRVLVAEDTGRPVGYAAVAEAPEATAAFLEVVVARFSRGRGVGRALVSAAEATARAQGLARLEVHASPDNGLAADFLKACGFRCAAAEAPGGGTVYRRELR